MNAPNLAPGIPLIESPFFSSIFNEDYQDKKVLAIARDLNNYGFAVIEFPDENINELSESIKRELHSAYDWKMYGADDSVDMRIQDAWKFNESVKAIVY